MQIFWVPSIPHISEILESNPKIFTCKVKKSFLQSGEHVHFWEHQKDKNIHIINNLYFHVDEGQSALTLTIIMVWDLQAHSLNS